MWVMELFLNTSTFGFDFWFNKCKYIDIKVGNLNNVFAHLVVYYTKWVVFK